MTLIDKVRNRLLDFVRSEKDVPLLAGFIVGFYCLTYYYSRNFSLANSLQQALFFTVYYLVLPAAAIFVGYIIFGKIKPMWRRHWIFTAMLGFFMYFMGQISLAENLMLWTGAVVAAAGIISVWLGKYYKAVIVLILFMSVFNLKPIAGTFYRYAISSDEWKKMPDGIENAVFKQKPNIYYIQPDGYTSFYNLKHNKHYKFDNSGYEAFLKNHGFSLYEDYRANYNTTLVSNAATFSMKHHYMQEYISMYAARSIIMDNPVLRILKNNGYKTSFITESPYLIINRPATLYDYMNIDYTEIPYFGDGFRNGTTKDVFGDLKAQMAKNKTSGQFYFVEQFLPGHVTGTAGTSTGIENERNKHMEGLKNAKAWLEEVIDYVVKNDPTAIIIVGADHGGYAGWGFTGEITTKTNDPDLVRSIFGAQLAIRWNDPAAAEYDKKIGSGVNLFRSMIAFMAREKSYLAHTEENGSYLPMISPEGVYQYIDDKGNVVFKKIK